MLVIPRRWDDTFRQGADDRFLNIRLDGIQVDDPERHPHMVCSLFSLLYILPLISLQ
jgi:hypothetical protein